MARSLGPSAPVFSHPAATLPRAIGQAVRQATPTSQGQGWSLTLTLLVPVLGSALALAPPAPALAGPVVCVNSLEAPLPVQGAAAGAPASLAPVLVARCGPVVTTPQLVERRTYTWTAPFAQGVDLVHQVTDLLGIAVAGRDGNTVMGLGFPDQTLIWDATAIEATNRVLLDAQSNPMPLRTADVFNGYCSGLAQGGCGLPLAMESPALSPRALGPAPAPGPVRGLW